MIATMASKARVMPCSGAVLRFAKDRQPRGSARLVVGGAGVQERLQADLAGGGAAGFHARLVLRAVLGKRPLDVAAGVEERPAILDRQESRQFVFSEPAFSGQVHQLVRRVRVGTHGRSMALTS